MLCSHTLLAVYMIEFEGINVLIVSHFEQKNVTLNALIKCDGRIKNKS